MTSLGDSSRGLLVRSNTSAALQCEVWLRSRSSTYLPPSGRFQRPDAADDVLAAVGWHLVPPELDQRPWRRMFVLPEQDRRIAHLQLVEFGHKRIRDTLTFRDQLRQRPEVASAYAKLKSAAAEQHRDDREAYTRAKTEFLRSVVADAT